VSTGPRNPSRLLFGDPPPPELRRDNTALLVVDMQYFDAHPDWGEGRTARELGVEAAFAQYFAEIDSIIPRIQELLRAARAAGVEVIHLRVAELTEDSRDVGRKQAVRGLFVPRSSKEAELLEEVAAEGDEIVISKSSSGVFAWTNLDRLLQTMGIDNLIFCGTSTGGCVESAVKDAADLGYRSLLVADACAAGTRADHERALERMDGGPNFVLATREVVERLAALAAEPVPERRLALGRHLATPLPTPDSGDVGDPYRLIFLPPPAPALDPRRTALLVMDMQRFTADADGGLARLVREHGVAEAFADYFERVEGVRPVVARLLDACRRAGVEVLHTRQAELTRDSRDAGPRQRARGIAIPRGSAEAEFVPGAEPVGDEIVLDRSGAGAFSTTHIDRLLRNLGVRTLILAGTSFDGGIEATTRSAGDRDYDVVVVEDACALYWGPRGARRMQGGGLTTVMTADDLAAAFAAQAARR
jgi:nicotinamidase-related amidase